MRWPCAATIALLLCGLPLGCRTPLSFENAAIRLWSQDEDDRQDELAGLTWIAGEVPPIDKVNRSHLSSRWRPSGGRGMSGSGGQDASEWPPRSVESSTTQSQLGARDWEQASPVELKRWIGQDGLAGWNAATLLCRRPPEVVDRRALEVVRRLVVDPPTVDPTTGFAADSTWATRFGRKPDASQTTRIPSSLRLAAAEAWLWSLGSTTDDPVEALAPVGRLLEDRTLSTSLRAELMRGVARWVPPARIPFLAVAFGEDARAHAPIEIRRAAMEACVVYAAWNPESVRGGRSDEAWPIRIEESESDSDLVVRAAYGTWVALVDTEDALDVLRRQLDDKSPRVRHNAINSLGRLATAVPPNSKRYAEVREELLRLVEREEVRVRSDAVAALGRLGVRELEPFVDDESGRVREVVAESLSRWPSPRAARHLLDLVEDRSLQVEDRAVAAVAEWPDELAVPVLLRAMESGTTRTRRAADAALRRRVTGVYFFDEQDEPPERRAVLAKIVARFELPTTPPPEVEASEPEVASWRQQAVLADLERVRDPEQRADALERLRQVEPAMIGLLERHLIDETLDVQEIVLREVLRDVSPVHGALVGLEGSDRRARVAAARRLAATARETPLSPFVVGRLRRTVAEGVADRDVWRAALEAVGPDGGEEAARLVQLALGFRWPDVQKLGCEYVERHPRSSYGPWLVPLFDDDHRSVRLAAVRAAVACRNPIVIDGAPGTGAPTLGGLRNLLRDEDVGIRTEAAVALALLGESEGLREVDRLARGPEPALRIEAIRAMARSGDRRFTGALIAIVRDDRADRVRREALDALRAIVPEVERPREVELVNAPQVASRAWEQWWARRASRSAAM